MTTDIRDIRLVATVDDSRRIGCESSYQDEIDAYLDARETRELSRMMRERYSVCG